MERLEQYFAANEIKDEKKRRAILLSVCGSKTYGLICDLLQPQKPGDSGLKDILEQLESHFSLKRSVIIEQFKIHSRNCLEGENVAEFVAGLRRFSEHCQFGTTLERHATRSTHLWNQRRLHSTKTVNRMGAHIRKGGRNRYSNQNGFK